MSNLLLQLQLLLAALSAFLPLVPERARARAGEILDVAAKALNAGAVIAPNLDDLAQKLVAIRTEIETLAAAGQSVSDDQLDAAMVHVRAASAAFRDALQTAEQGGA